MASTAPSSALTAHPQAPASRVAFPAVIGWTALVLAVLLWAGFALSLRAIGHSPLTTADVALLRFGVPAVILLPLVPSRWPMLRRVAWQHVATVAVGGGLPFFFAAAYGGRLSSAAHVSALIAGTTPLAVAILGYVAWRDRPARRSRPGLAVIIVGVGLLVGSLHVAGLSAIGGVALLLGASLMWGAFTLALRRAGTDPIGSAMLVTYPALLLLLPLMGSGLLDSHLGRVSIGQLLPFALIQGLGTGICSTLAYATAIRYLGALRCATVGALAPVIVTILAVPLLGEVASPLAMIGVAVIVAGVIATNRAMARTAPARPA